LEFPTYANHLSAIQFISSKLSDGDQLIVLGDFNIPRATWSTVETLNILLPSTQHDFLDGLLDISLSQVNHVLNFLGRLMDLCFVSSPDCVCIARTSAITLPEVPYHPTLELTIDTGTKVYKVSEKIAKRIPVRMLEPVFSVFVGFLRVSVSVFCFCVIFVASIIGPTSCGEGERSARAAIGDARVRLQLEQGVAF